MTGNAPLNQVECGKINVLALALGVLLPFVLGTAHGQSHALTFEKEIGIGWRMDKSGWMSFVSFSPDGTMVASDGPATPDDTSGALTLWSFPEGRLIKHLSVRPSAISGDWKYYVTDNAVVELQTGKQLISLGKEGSAVFSPDSRYVAEVGVRGDSAIRILELPTGKQVSAFGKQSPFAIAMSPDGLTLASGYWDIVTLRNLHTGERQAVLQGFGRYVAALSFSPDGKLLAGGTDAGGIQIWDVGRVVRLASLDIGGGEVSDPAFSPDSRLVAVGATVGEPHF